MECEHLPYFCFCFGIRQKCLESTYGAIPGSVARGLYAGTSHYIKLVLFSKTKIAHSVKIGVGEARSSWGQVSYRALFACCP